MHARIFVSPNTHISHTEPLTFMASIYYPYWRKLKAKTRTDNPETKAHLSIATNMFHVSETLLCYFAFITYDWVCNDGCN